MPIDINFAKLPQFYIKPFNTVIKPLANSPFVATYSPIIVGKHHRDMEISMM